MSNSHLFAARLALVEKVATRKPLDYKEIAAATFTSEPHIIRCIKTLREANRLHIAEWRLHGRARVALYLAGPGKDVTPPPPMTRAESRKAYRDRIRKDPVANALYLAQKRAKCRATKAAERPQTWMSALLPQPKGGPRPKSNQEGASC